MQKGQTLAADLSAPPLCTLSGGAGGLPSGNTPVRTRAERPKAGLTLCAQGWARWATRKQRAREEQGKSKGRASEEQAANIKMGSPLGGCTGRESAERGSGKGRRLRLTFPLPLSALSRVGQGDCPDEPPCRVAGSGNSRDRYPARGRGGAKRTQRAREKHTHKAYISKIMIIAYLR